MWGDEYVNTLAYWIKWSPFLKHPVLSRHLHGFGSIIHSVVAHSKVSLKCFPPCLVVEGQVMGCKAAKVIAWCDLILIEVILDAAYIK